MLIYNGRPLFSPENPRPDKWSCPARLALLALIVTLAIASWGLVVLLFEVVRG
jgi:hypothetical protein